jgi:redox-sensitive bicupin YhaK (pirin superfamily)
MGFRSLRVINENRVKPGVGFPLHAQQDMEIISIVLEGKLAHQDDLGNGSILYPGYVQLMSAGKGITHAELNASDKESLYFLQLWILPNIKNLTPSYQESFFPDSVKHNQWRLIVSPDGHEESLKIHQDVEIYLTAIDEGKMLIRQLKPGRYGWLQMIHGNVELNNQLLERGDGASISETEAISIVAKTSAKFVFFDFN